MGRVGGFIGEKTRKYFPAEFFFCMSCMKCLAKCPYSKKPVLPEKIPGSAPVTINLISWFLEIYQFTGN